MTTRGIGRCLIDAVEVGEISIDLFKAEPVIQAKYAYVAHDEDRRMGFGNKNTGWSSETFSRLKELIESMEQDICHRVFAPGGTADGAITDIEPVDDVPAL